MNLQWKRILDSLKFAIQRWEFSSSTYQKILVIKNGKKKPVHLVTMAGGVGYTSTKNCMGWFTM